MANDTYRNKCQCNNCYLIDYTLLYHNIMKITLLKITEKFSDEHTIKTVRMVSSLKVTEVFIEIQLFRRRSVLSYSPLRNDCTGSPLTLD